MGRLSAFQKVPRLALQPKVFHSVSNGKPKGPPRLFKLGFTERGFIVAEVDNLLDRIKNLQDTAAYIEADESSAISGKFKRALDYRVQADKLWRLVLADCAARGIEPPARP